MSRIALLIAVYAALLSCNATLGRTAGPADTPEILPQSPDGNFTLYVSNQSFDSGPVDIRITIDGKTAVDGAFRVGNQHNWKAYTFELPSGPHTLEADARKGRAELKTEFTIAEKHWAVINYWYRSKARGDNPPEEPKLTFDISDQPIGFVRSPHHPIDTNRQKLLYSAQIRAVSSGG